MQSLAGGGEADGFRLIPASLERGSAGPIRHPAREGVVSQRLLRGVGEVGLEVFSEVNHIEEYIAHPEPNVKPTYKDF